MPKPINYFNTHAGFKNRLEMGTFTNLDDCIVFIKDKKLIWVKGLYFSTDIIPEYIKNVAIELNGGKLRLAVTKKTYDTTNLQYNENVARNNIITATSTLDGLLSSTDKAYLDSVPTKISDAITECKNYAKNYTDNSLTWKEYN